MIKPRIAWASLAVVGAVSVGAWRFLALAGFNDDHYVHLSGAQQMTFGEWPSRDFVDAGAPLMYAVSSIVLWMAPHAPLLGEALLVSLMFAVSAALTVYAGRRLTGSLLLALLAVALEIVIFPRTYSYPKVLAYAAGFLAMWRYVDRPSPARMLQLAAVVVGSFLLRHDHGLYIGAGGVVSVVFAAPNVHEALRKATMYLCIVMVLLTPYVAYVQYYDGIDRHVARGLQLSALENSRGRRAPAFVFEPNAFQANAIPWLYYEFYFLPLVTATVAWARWRRSKDHRELAMVLPLIVVAVPMNLGMIRETVSARLPDAVVPACLQLAWLLSRARDVRSRALRVPVWATAVVVVLVTAGSAVVIGSTREQLERAELLDGVSRLTRQFHDRVHQLRARFPPEQMPSRTAYALLPFFAYGDRCLDPRDHILVPAFFPEISVWARRPFAGGQVVFQAGALGDEDDHRLVIERLNAQRVPVVILTPEADLLTRDFEELSTYIAAHFTEVVSQNSDGDQLIRIGFDPRLAIGRDPETGWPCYR